MDDKIMKVGITHGDINGISYELLLKTFSDQRMTELCTPVIYGSPKILSYHRKALDFQQVPMTTIGKVEEAAPGRVSIINCISDEVKVELSKATEYAATAAEQAVDMACADLQRGAIDALVTAPVGSPLRKGAEESLAARTGTGI
jgi:4-hydroxythreonine-4-phosphate dehydrogenase